jgi:osmotically-inducible protein OsmY
MASSRQYERMTWRAAGAQFYPGGAYESLQELAHRGRGPKGYRRSDERLKEIICERLTEDPFIDASDITVDVSNGAVTLQGSVLARPQKHAAEDLVAEVAGVAEIHNELRVGSDDIEARTSGL